MATLKQNLKIKSVAFFDWSQTSHRLERHKSLPTLYKHRGRNSGSTLEISEKMSSLQRSHSESDIASIFSSGTRFSESGGGYNKLKPLLRGINFKNFNYNWKLDVSQYIREHIWLFGTMITFRTYNAFYRKLRSDVLIHDPNLAGVNLDAITSLDVIKGIMVCAKGKILFLNYKYLVNHGEHYACISYEECRDVGFYDSFARFQYRLHEFILPRPTNGILEYLITLDHYPCNRVLDQARKANLIFAAIAVRNVGLMVRAITSVTFSDFFSDDCLSRLHYSANNSELFGLVSNFTSLGTTQVKCSLEKFFKDKKDFGDIVLYPLPKLIEMQIARNIQFYLHWFLAVSFQDRGFNRVSFMKILPNAVGQLKESVDLIIRTQKKQEYFRKLRQDHKALLVLHMVLAEIRLSVGCQGEVFDFSEEWELE